MTTAKDLFQRAVGHDEPPLQVDYAAIDAAGARHHRRAQLLTVIGAVAAVLALTGGVVLGTANRSPNAAVPAVAPVSSTAVSATPTVGAAGPATPAPLAIGEPGLFRSPTGTGIATVLTTRWAALPDFGGPQLALIIEVDLTGVSGRLDTSGTLDWRLTGSPELLDWANPDSVVRPTMQRENLGEISEPELPMASLNPGEHSRGFLTFIADRRDDLTLTYGPVAQPPTNLSWAIPG